MRFLKKIAPFALILAVAILLLYLPDIGPERYNDLGNFFKTELRRQAYHGYSVAVVQDGAVLYVDAFGKDGAGTPLEVDTPLLLGSVSKTFTGLVTLSLAREKLVSIDLPVTNYLPWFAFAPAPAPQGGGAAPSDPSAAGPAQAASAPQSAAAAPAPGPSAAAASTVTLRHLLSQTSGVSDRAFDDLHAEAPDLESAVRSMLVAVPSAAPGAKEQYINTGYQAVALALEKATTLSFNDLVQVRILRPLGMLRSSASPSKVAGAIPPGSGSFFGIAIPRRPEILPFGAPSGYMVSTASDMAKYLAYLAGPEKVPRTPVPARNLPALFEPLVEASPYSYGWRISGSGEDLEASHSGSLDGYSASITLWPGRRAGLVVLAPQNSLLQSMIAMPALVDGARSILTKGASDRPFPLGRMYILLAVTAGVHILALLIQIAAALAWARDVRCKVEAVGTKGPLRGAVALSVLGIAIRVALVAFAPVGLEAVFHRAMSWGMAFVLEPGLAGWAMAALCLGSLRNAARLAWLGGPR